MNEQPTSRVEPVFSTPKNEAWRVKPYLKFENNFKRTQEVESIIEKHESDGMLIFAVEEYYKKQLAGNPLLGKQLAEIFSLQTELNAVEEELDDLIGDESEQAEQRQGKLSSRSEILSQKIDTLRSDPDIMFFLHVSDGIEDLKSRAIEIEKCKEDPIKYFKESGWEFPCEEVIYSDVGATFVINQKVWDEHFGEGHLEGVHYSGSIINLVRKNSDAEQMEETMRHENKHAFFEVFFKEQARVFGVGDASKIFSNIVRMSELGAPRDMIRVTLDDFKNKIWEKYLSGIKNELIANYEGLKGGSFSTDFVIYLEIFSWMREMESRSKGAERNLFQEAREMLENKCQEFYRQLSDILFLAEKTNVSEDVHSAMLLLDPLEYGKIEQYLIWKVGTEKYATHQALRRIIRTPFFTITKSSSKAATPEEKLIDQIKSDNNPLIRAARLESKLDGLNKKNIEHFSLDEFSKIALTDEERKLFEKTVKDILEDVHHVTSLLSENPAYISEYLDKLTQILQIAKVDVDTEHMKASTWTQYIYDKTDPFIEANNVGFVLELIQSIGADDRKYLSEGFLSLKENLESHGLLQNQKWQKVLQMLEMT